MSEVPKYLLLHDFDGNLAQTFQPSPDGIGVNEAHDFAIFNIFGPKGREAYHETLGGLQNRAPTQLVQALLDTDPDGLFKREAEIFFLDNVSELDQYVPEGLGFPLVWDGAVGIMTELLVREKLRFLMTQIGKNFKKKGDPWPRPFQGLEEFWMVVDDIKAEGGVEITTAVVSSGHHNFINKTFETWGLTRPDILITEDSVRGTNTSLPLALRVKPGPIPLSLAYNQWKKCQCPPANHLSAPFTDCNRMMMFGDDLKKDGGLARGAAIPFGWHTKGKAYSLNSKAQVVQFDDWCHPADQLDCSRAMLKAGRSLHDIFFTQ